MTDGDGRNIRNPLFGPGVPSKGMPSARPFRFWADIEEASAKTKQAVFKVVLRSAQ
jgi:hypothetical protein